MNNKIVFSLLTFLLSSCASFFGTKSDLSFIDVPDFSVRAVAYVPIQPAITNFVDPSDIIVGYDQLIYVVDAGAEQIIAYDESLLELARLSVPGVTTIAQDRRLDLYAIGTLDTVINSVLFKLPCVYKYDLKNGIYGLANAQLVHRIIHPFYVTNTLKVSDNQVKFTGITVLADNSIYIARSGPSVNNLVGGPDDGILFFNNDKANKYQYSISVNTSEGSRNDFFKRPTGITSFIAPPQSAAIRDNYDFAYLTNNPTEPLKVKLMRYLLIDDAPAYQLNQDLIVGDTSRADGFLYTPGKFTDPVDIAFAGDGTQLLFVADQAKDSIFIFNINGLEGLNPPVGSSSRKSVKVSFGGKGQTLTRFDRPRAVAYEGRILYVVDSGNRRVLRFRLTTDFR
jgi:hypothetical protein